MMLVEDLILFFNLSSQSRHKFESIVYCITPLDKMSLSIIGKKKILQYFVQAYISF